MQHIVTILIAILIFCIIVVIHEFGIAVEHFRHLLARDVVYRVERGVGHAGDAASR